MMNVQGRWADAAKGQERIGWCRDLFAATAPYATGEAYVNFMTGEEGDRLEDASGDSHQRLVDTRTGTTRTTSSG